MKQLKRCKIKLVPGEEEEEVRMRYIPNQGITQMINISSLSE
jgi:hypothetical protein